MGRRAGVYVYLCVVWQMGVCVCMGCEVYSVAGVCESVGCVAGVCVLFWV